MLVLDVENVNVTVLLNVLQVILKKFTLSIQLHVLSAVLVVKHVLRMQS